TAPILWCRVHRSTRRSPRGYTSCRLREDHHLGTDRGVERPAFVVGGDPTQAEAGRFQQRDQVAARIKALPPFEVRDAVRVSRGDSLDQLRWLPPERAVDFQHHGASPLLIARSEVCKDRGSVGQRGQEASLGPEDSTCLPQHPQVLVILLEEPKAVE